MCRGISINRNFYSFILRISYNLKKDLISYEIKLLNHTEIPDIINRELLIDYMLLSFLYYSYFKIILL